MELRPEAAKDSTEFNIDILEDRARALSEFEALRGQAPFVAVDSATIGPALRALASHGLIRKLSAPKISCELGDTATMSTDSLQEHDGPEINLRLTANRTDRGKVMEVQLVTMHESEKRKIDFAVYVKPGQTVLIPITDESNKSKSASAPNPICLAITPSFPKSPTTSAAPKSYYYQPSEPPTAE